MPDLGPADFIVREDNVAREVLKVAPAVDPMQIALLVDNSQAARDDIRDIRTRAPGVHHGHDRRRAGGGKNQVAIIALAERPTILADYTVDADRLIKGVDRICRSRRCGDYLLDGIVEVSRGLQEARRQPPGDRRDHHRRTGAQLPAATTRCSSRSRDSGAALSRDRRSGRRRTAISDEARNRDIVLDQGTGETGGRHDELLDEHGARRAS